MRLQWLRCLGEVRLYLYAVRAIVRKKTYRGKLSLRIVRSWSTYTSEGARCDEFDCDEDEDEDGV